MSKKPAKDAHRVFHININCTDFDRSLAFYELLGFEVILDFDDRPGPRLTFADVGLAPVLRLPEDCDGRAAMLALSDDVRETRIDLIEWRTPKVDPERRRGMAQVGVARICLKVHNAQAIHHRLVDAGHAPYTAPTPICLGGSEFCVFCCEDPDGVVFEFMQFRRPDPRS